MQSAYSPPLALTVVSGIFLALGALCFLIITGDIILRRGWRSMMLVMVPVYPINAAYMLPLTMFVYFKYGRPSKPIPSSTNAQPQTASCHAGAKQSSPEQPSAALGMASEHDAGSDGHVSDKHCTNDQTAPTVKTCHSRLENLPADSPSVGSADETGGTTDVAASHCCNSSSAQLPTPPSTVKPCHQSADAPSENAFSSASSIEKAEAADEPASHCCRRTPQPAVKSCHQSAVAPSDNAFSTASSVEKAEAADEPASHCCHHSAPDRPLFATLLVGVSHCGAGCVLGDLVGEWLVYGTGASLGGHSIWAELLIDYAFALLFGIAFQYMSIAPMSGEWGPRSVWRAAKADILSLTSFEIGAFGWMIIYQVGIFNYQLSMDTWTYWWMMQIGMAFGYATALPANYFLLKYKIKEPCC